MPPVSAAASAPAPRRIRGGAAGVRPRRRARRSEQMVDVPDRVAAGVHYSDEAVKAWAKAAALDLDGNREHCNASVENLAGYAGMSKSPYERGLTQLRVPGPDGGPAEMATRRMTHRGGKGRTAIRQVRPVRWDENAVRVPPLAGDTLPPREYRALLALSRAARDRIPVAAADLAGELFHHHGDKAGQPVSERTARRVMDRLEARGWITVDRRGGFQGRHLFTVHTSPLRPVPATPDPAPCPDNHDGSGPDSHDGSLTIKEDNSLSTDQRPQGRRASTTVDPPIRRRRDNSNVTVENPQPSAAAGGGRPYTGPPLTVSPRIAAVLAPGPHRELAPLQALFAASTVFMQRRIAREIGRQLDTEADTGRLRHRLRERYARTGPAAVRDGARWLLGAALPRWGCPDPRCETGVLWHPDGRRPRCDTCRDTPRPGPEPGPGSPPLPPPPPRPPGTD